ncbi:MAG: hypothetical protein K8S16_14825, partial [Bacteroidales bacterium]|nr:hypothetical protein [Bacteroidales bacterium]
MKQFFSYLRNHYSEINKIALFVLSVVFLLLVFPKEGKFKYEFTKGKPWMHDDLIAPFDFAILKSAGEIESEQQQVLKKLTPYFRFDTIITKTYRNTLIEEFNSIWDIKYHKNKQSSIRKNRNKKLCLSIYDSIIQKGVIESNNEIVSGQEDQSIYVIKDNIVEEKKTSDFFSIQSAD